MGHSRVGVHLRSLLCPGLQVRPDAATRASSDLPCSEPIVALSWIFTSSRTPVLAVALRSRVFVISVHRRRYLSHSSAWSVLASVSLQQCVPCPRSCGLALTRHSITSSPITALTWSSSGSVIASTSNHLFRLASPSAASVLDDADVGSGPVPVYHPQLLQHCLLAGAPTSDSLRPQFNDIVRTGKAHLVDHVLLALHDALQWQTGDGPLAVPFDLYAFLGGFATDVPATTEVPALPCTRSSRALTSRSSDRLSRIPMPRLRTASSLSALRALPVSIL